jgi:hypothetical protein
LDNDCSARFVLENEGTETDSRAQIREVALITKKTLSLLVKEDAEEIFFHLKRFTTNNPNTEGSSAFVATKKLREVSLKNSLIDDENLKDVLEFEVEGEPNQKKRFKPTGFIWHKGKSLNSGHYITYALELDEQSQPSWYLYDDGQKSEVGNKGEEFQLFQERINQAYIIKYSAIGNSNEPNIPKSSDQKCGASNIGNTCWANAVIALVGSSSLVKNCQKNILNETEEEKQLKAAIEESLKEQQRQEEQQRQREKQQRQIVLTKSKQDQQIADALAESLKQREDKKLEEFQGLLNQAQKITPLTESPSYKKSDTIHFDLGDFFREKTAATKTIEFKINYDLAGKKTDVEKESSTTNKIQTTQEYTIKTKALDSERTTTSQSENEGTELDKSTEKQKLEEVEVEVTGPTFKYQEAKPKTVKKSDGSKVEIEICKDSGKTFPIITPEVLSLNNTTQIVDSAGVNQEGFKKSYYSKFGGSKFLEKNTGGDKIFGNADLFMSSFRNCVFENVDFSKVKNFGTIGFYGCKFEGCVFSKDQEKFFKEQLSKNNSNSADSQSSESDDTTVSSNTVQVNLDSFEIKSKSPSPSPYKAKAVLVATSKGQQPILR